MANYHFLYGRQLTYLVWLAEIENMDAGIIFSDSLKGLLGFIFFGAHTTVVCRCKMTSSVEFGVELALEGNSWDG